MPRDNAIVKNPTRFFPASKTFAFVGNVNRLALNAHIQAKCDIISATVFYCVKGDNNNKKTAKMMDYYYFC